MIAANDRPSSSFMDTFFFSASSLWNVNTGCFLIGSKYFRLCVSVPVVPLPFVTVLVILERKFWLACSPRSLVVETFCVISAGAITPVEILISGWFGDHIFGTRACSPANVLTTASSSCCMRLLPSSTWFVFVPLVCSTRCCFKAAR